MTGHELRNYREGLRVPLVELANELRASRFRLGQLEQLPEVPPEQLWRVLQALRRIHTFRRKLLADAWAAAGSEIDPE